MKKYFGLLLTAVAVAAAPVIAQTEESTQLEEVVITTQKRTEKLQDVPVSAAVVSSDALARTNASDIADLNNLVPSVNLNGTFNGRVPMGIRGISTVSNEFTVGLTSGVAVMLDGVPVPSDSYSANVLEDVASIEVLKGPQATLGGRTAASGVINIVTRKPSDTFTGSTSATLTNDNEYRLSGFISGPISQRVNYSLSAYGNKRDWPVKNLALDKRSNLEIYGVRGKLLFRPTDNLDVTFTARYGKNDSEGFNFVYTYLTPGFHLLTGAGGPPFLSQAALLPGITVNQDNQSYASPISAYARIKDTDASLNIDYRIGALTLGSTTAYQRENQTNVQDLFAVNGFFWNELTGAGSGAPGTPPPFYNTQTQTNLVTQVSEELKLVSPGNDPFNYLVGLFYSDSKIEETTERGLLPAFYDNAVAPRAKTYDLYGRTSWRFRPATALVTGLRYNYDEISYDYTEKLVTVVFPPPVIVGGNYPAISSSGSSNSSVVVGDVSLQQTLATNSMGYLTYARGYSPSAYNTTEFLTPASPFTSAKLNLTAVPKETIDHFELGSKGSYLDGRLKLNVAAFYTKYKNFQVQVFDRSSASINPPLILAPAGADTRGLELDTNWAATGTLLVNFNAAYVDAKFNSYPDAPCWYGEPAPQCVYTTSAAGIVTGTQNLSGKPMPNAPKFKFVLGVEQRIPLSASGLDLIVAGNYSHRTAAQMLTDQNPQAVQPAFGILNLTVGLHDQGGRYSATLFANNVFNKHYFVDLEDFWSGPWNSNAVIGQPARDTNRYYGLRLSANFGAGH